MNIFVASLNFRTSEDDLIELFEQFGTVTSAKIVLDRETGRSRGFGFVEMANAEQGAQAIKQLNSTEFDDRTIVVKEAEERRSNDRGGDRGGNDRGGDRGGNDRRGGGGFNKRY